MYWIQGAVCPNQRLMLILPSHHTHIVWIELAGLPMFAAQGPQAEQGYCAIAVSQLDAIVQPPSAKKQCKTLDLCHWAPRLESALPKAISSTHCVTRLLLASSPHGPYPIALPGACSLLGSDLNAGLKGKRRLDNVYVIYAMRHQNGPMPLHGSCGQERRTEWSSLRIVGVGIQLVTHIEFCRVIIIQI